MNKKNGFTLVEVMIVSVVFTSLMGLVFFPMLGVIRSVKMDATILEMDRSANQALLEIAEVLRPAVLPIPVTAPDNLLGEFSRNIINSPVRGFGGQNGSKWSKILKDGSDFVPFCIPVDYGDDGDYLDMDNYMELGMVHPGAGKQFGAAYVMNNGRNQLAENASAHSHLARFAPADMDLPESGASINTGSARFAASLAFPAKANQAFACIRFVPRRTDGGNGAPFSINESAVNYDINGDGDMQDSFMIGHIEVSYPGARKIVSGPSVLLQTNRDESWTPIFKQVRYRENDSSPNTVFDENGDGQYGILVRLLLCDNHGQQDPIAFNKTSPALVRRYETVVKLRNMAAN